jgi:hypothetical protein
MRLLPALLLGLSLAAGAAEPELAITPDPLVRAGLVFRCRVQSKQPISGAASVTVALIDGERVLAASEVTLVSPNQLAAGVTVVLVASAAARAPRLEVRVADAVQRALLRRAQAVSGVGDGQELMQARARLLELGTTEPLPWLWYEQAQELALEPLPTIAAHAALMDVLARLAAWPLVPAAPGPTHLLAFRDPVDGSVQPARLTRDGDVSANAPLAVVLRPQTVTKSNWAPLPAAWLAAAATAGVAVLEIYPAGDAAFVGAARRRIPLAVAAARAVAPLLGPIRVVAGDARLETARGWTDAVAPIAPAPPRGRLCAWAEGPFVVVVGTGEHRAARADARQLAEAFVRAWAAHAHGLPPVLDDTAYRPGDWADHHLVLIGSPRSNIVLKQLVEELGPSRFPVTWDDRDLHLGTRTCLRARRPGLALAVPRPDAPTLTMLVLDGSPAWTGALGTCPLAAEAVDADLVLRPGDPSEGDAFRLLLESQPGAP